MSPETAATLAQPLVLSRRGRAMASDISLTVHWNADATRGAAESQISAIDRALEVFHAVERACTRFDPQSPLMVANSDGESWHEVPRECFLALCEAERAHRITAGRFDPRILNDLLRLGYDSTMRFPSPSAILDRSQTIRQDVSGDRPQRPRWQLGTIAGRHQVRIGPEPVDLGGIGKGLAVRWAAAEVASSSAAGYLVDAGGDCHCGGTAPDGDKWKIAVEDPNGGSDPVVVLELTNRACATSSTRLRKWHDHGQPVHHLLDPRTGQPAGGGLASVTVVGRDAAMAEVWAKALFVEGLDRAGAIAARRGIAALWTDVAGHTAFSPAMATYICWSRVALG